MQLITEIIHPELKSVKGRVFRRHAARGIVLRDEQILLCSLSAITTLASLAAALMPMRTLSQA